MDVEFSREILRELEAVPVDDELSVYRLNILRSTLFKKFKPSRDRASVLKYEAFDKFLSNNEYIRNIDVKSSPYIRNLRAELEWVFSSNIEDPSFSVSSFMNFGSCGPGSSVGCSRDTSFLKKMFHSSLSSTSWNLYRVYRSVLSERWNMAEDIRLRSHSLSTVKGSRLQTVPKDDTKDRTIAVEPTLNMYAQLGAKHMLNRILKTKYNLDISKQQPINRAMARSGSQNQRLATLDLSDASDFISTQLCKEVLPPNVFNSLDAIRSKFINVYGEDIELSMFATMGNGFCFSLMTLIFTSLLCSVYRSKGIHPQNGKNFAVYGDDIICISEIFPDLCSALESLGLKINLNKSYSTGFFRESCGGDYFHGHNVRGVYIKDLSNAQQHYIASNMLLSWSVHSGIDISAVICRFLDRAGNLFLVPSRAGSYGGLIVPREHTRYLPRDSNGSRCYKSYEPVVRSVKIRKNMSQPFGAYISFLGGYVRNMRYSLRENDTSPRYKIQNSVDPIWEDGQDRYFGSHFCEEAGIFVDKLLSLLTLTRLERLMK